MQVREHVGLLEQKVAWETATRTAFYPAAQAFKYLHS